jgi:hypothetical protein
MQYILILYYNLTKEEKNNLNIILNIKNEENISFTIEQNIVFVFFLNTNNVFCSIHPSSPIKIYQN